MVQVGFLFFFIFDQLFLKKLTNKNTSKFVNRIGDDNKNNANANANNNTDETIMPQKLQQMLKLFFSKTYGYTITGYVVSQNKIKFETNDKRCMYKKQKFGIDEHKSNHVYFVVFTNNLYHLQGCYDSGDCSENGVPGVTNLGFINDNKIVEEFRQWKNNSRYCAFRWDDKHPTLAVFWQIPLKSALSGSKTLLPGPVLPVP